MQIHFRYTRETYNSSDWALNGVGPSTVPNLLAMGIQPYQDNVNLVRHHDALSIWAGDARRAQIAMSWPRQAGAEERRVINVDAIGSDLVAAQIKDIDEWHAERRAVVARIGHFALANRGRRAVPGIEQPMPARGNCREKRRDAAWMASRPTMAGALPKRNCASGSEQLNEAGRIAGIDDRKHPLPPCAIRLKEASGATAFIVCALIVCARAYRDAVTQQYQRVATRGRICSKHTQRSIIHPRHWRDRACAAAARRAISRHASAVPYRFGDARCSFGTAWASAAYHRFNGLLFGLALAATVLAHAAPTSTTMSAMM